MKLLSPENDLFHVSTLCLVADRRIFRGDLHRRDFDRWSLDLTIWQALVQFPSGLPRNQRTGSVQVTQVRQPFQVLDGGIGDGGARKRQYLWLRHLSEVTIPASVTFGLPAR